MLQRAWQCPGSGCQLFRVPVRFLVKAWGWKETMSVSAGWSCCRVIWPIWAVGSWDEWWA